MKVLLLYNSRGGGGLGKKWIVLKNINKYTGVPLQDVKGHDASDRSKVNFIHRSNVLPLPNSYEDTADWGSMYLEEVRVDVMYPSTTSLYPATTIENTIYSQNQDDIMCLVEFDNDEDETTKKTSKRHIPSKFVTLIPNELKSSNHIKRHKKVKKDPTVLVNEKNVSKDDMLSNVPIAATCWLWKKSPLDWALEEEHVGLQQRL